MSKIRIDTATSLGGPKIITQVVTNPSPVVLVHTSPWQWVDTSPVVLGDNIPIRHYPTGTLIESQWGVGQKFYDLRLFSLLSEGLQSLPVLPLRAEGYYDDNNNANQKWYFPIISLKTPAEGGFRFKCYKDGIDAGGKDVYKGDLTLRFRKSEPEAVRQIRERADNTLTFSPIPVPYLNGTITLKIENIDTPVQVSTMLNPATADFEIVVPIAKDSLGLWYRTMKDPTLGAPLALEAQFFGWEKPTTPQRIELLDLAASARWAGAELTDADNTRNSADLPWQGSDGDDRGFVRIDTAYLEDGLAYRTLRTHPKWVNHGTIKGWFPWRPLPKNARFEAKVGFMSGAVHSDGVTFQVWEHHHDSALKREVWNKIIDKFKPYNGKLASISASLAHLEGQNVGIEFRVDSGASSGQDWAAWVEPCITGDEYIKKTVTEKHGFQLSYNCSLYPEFYQLQKSDGSALSVGCTPPWNADFSPEVPYVAYNKVNLSDLGVSAVFKSILRDDQFLLIPARYIIARDADKLPEIFISVKADLENSGNSKALLAIKLAPDISDIQLSVIKKRLVQSWESVDISSTIDLVFPSQIDSVDNDNPDITPIVKLGADQNYAHGPGNALNLSLENLSLHNASLLMLIITEGMGRSFNFGIKMGGNMAPVHSVAALTFKDLAGSFVVAGREGNTVRLANLFDREVTISNLLAELPGRAANIDLPVSQIVKSGEALSIDLPEAMRVGSGFAAGYTVGLGDPYEIRENNVTTDNIRQDFTADCSEIFKDAAVNTVEISVQMKNSANNVLRVFDSARQTGIITLFLPVGFYLAARVIDYALRISYQDPTKAEQTRSGKMNLRESSLLALSTDQTVPV